MSEEEPKSSEGELLRAWEARIDAAGDPLGALADVLGERRAQRAALFQRVGQEVLGCRLTRILGAGGMGVTYAGVTGGGDAVAVKLVSGVAGPARERFEQECRALRRVSHAAVVRYRDHAVLPDGTGVLVMDLVEGVDLQRLLDEAPIADANVAPWSELLRDVEATGDARLRSPRFQRRILRLLATVADGLHAAHQCGIVHRDVKPANVLVRADLSPVLIDFGLARDLQVKVSLTASGMAMGTLAYMAPEQLGREEGPVDARTDVYAVGLMLYRAALGVEAREDVASVLRAKRRPFVLDRAQSRVVPLDQQAVLYACLDRRPSGRYATAATLADDLRAAAGQGTVSARRPSSVRRFLRDGRRVAIAAAALLAIGAATVAWTWPRGRWVVFASNASGEQARVRVPAAGTVTLGTRVWLPYGTHDVTIKAPGHREVTKSIEVKPGAGDQWATILTFDEGLALPVAPGSVPVAFMTGHSIREMAPGVSCDCRSIDGRELPDGWPHGPGHDVPAGAHEFVAKDGRGREERLRVTVGDEPIDLQMLPMWMAQVDGSFRRTWSTIVSPLPESVRIRADAETWLGIGQVEVIGGGGTNEAPCAFVPGAGNAPAEVVLRCEFPEPMRSAVVLLRGTVTEGGELDVAARFGDCPWTPWPRRLKEPTQVELRQAFRSNGAKFFEVRARLVAPCEPGSHPITRFLHGMQFGAHWHDEPPCFAIVADPTEKAVWPPPSPVARLEDVKALPMTERVLGESILDWIVLPGPGGSLDLVGAQPQAASGGAGGSWVRRWSWPSMVQKTEWSPERLGTTTRFSVGLFGAGLAAIDDADGDGWCEIALGDASSATGSVNAGTVWLLSSASGTALWQWPLASANANRPLYEEVGERVLRGGDWNGDGLGDVLVSATHAPALSARGDLAQAGRVTVLDARGGGPIHEWFGDAANQRMQLIDARSSGAGPADVLVSLNQATNDFILGQTLAVWSGGRAGALSKGPPGTPVAAPVLLGEAGKSKPVSVLVLRAGETADGFVGLERFEVDAGKWKLVQQQPLALGPWPSSQHGLLDRKAGLRIPDVDGDGFEDAVFVLTMGPRPGLLQVSGRTLRLVAFADVAGATGSPLWVPNTSGGGSVLVAFTRSTEQGEVHGFAVVGVR